MRKYIFKHKGWLALTVFFRSFGALMLIFIALIIQKIVDTAMNKDIEGFIKVLIFSAIFFSIMALNDYLNKTTQFIYIKKTLTDFKADVFKGVLRKDYKSFNSENTAEYISNLTNDINMVESKCIVPSLEMIGDVIIFVGTTIVLLSINVWITLVTFLAAALLLLVPSIFGSIVAKRQSLVSNEFSSFTKKIKDIFSGFEVIKSYNIEKTMTKEFLDANNQVEGLKFKANHVQGIAESTSTFLAIMTQVSAIAVGGYFLIKGSLTVGTLFAVVQLGNGINGPIMWIMNKTTMLRGMKEVVNKLLNIIKENEKNTGKSELNSFDDNIELNNVTFSYDDERVVLDKVSLKIEKNKKYAIVGRSGSGKSTILKLILGYYDDFKGKIKFDNKEYRNLDKNSINNQISMIHQNVYMFDKTLKDNIILGKEFKEDEINNALNNSGVNEFLNILPDGINSHIGENGNTLSGGQRQRVAVARSFIQNTPILLLDEGTSALDAKTASDIENGVLSMEGLTVVTVTHKLDEDVLSKYDEIIVMDKGKIVEKGTLSDLLQQNGEFYKLYSV